jgi:hypothetical protein
VRLGLPKLSLHRITPGGGSFSPAQIAGLKLWLKADTGLFQDSPGTTAAVANADPVGLWKDQSGQGNDVLQATSTMRPTLRLAVQNGQPVVRFDGVDDFLQKAALALAQPLTVFAVAKVGAPGAAPQNIMDGVGGSNRDLFGKENTSEVWRMYAGGSILDSAAASDTSWHTFACLFSGTGSLLRVDGSQKISGSAGTQSLTGLNLGCSSATNQQLLNGDIAEFLLYTADLTASFALLEAYLKGRYATP